MSDFYSGLPVTSVADPAVLMLTTTTGSNGGPLLCYVVGGTIGASFSFVGSVSTDIGSVKIEDADDNYAVVPPASDAKSGSTKALVVQQIDDQGHTLRQVTQQAILDTQGTQATSALQVAGGVLMTALLNSQGTQATSVLQTAGNVLLTAIMNNQGTQASVESGQSVVLSTILNNQGTQATSALQTAGGVVMATVMNNQGTLATSALQTTGNSLLTTLDSRQGTLATSALQAAGNAALTVIMNNQGTQSSSDSTRNVLLSAVMNNQGTQATSALQTTGNSTLTLIDGRQGTLATSALQTAQNVLFVSQDTHLGTLATSALQTSGNNLLSLIDSRQGTQSTAGLALNTSLVNVYNNQGTQATSALQTTGNTLLTAIDSRQGTLATEATLTAISNTLTQTGTRSVLYTQTGNAIDATLDSNGDYHLAVTALQSVYASTKNAYSGTLAFGGSYVGTAETTLGINAIQVTLKADQNCIVYVDQSSDGTNWDINDAYNYYYSLGGNSWTTQAVSTQFRVRVVNSSVAHLPTTYTRLSTALCPIVEALPRHLSDNGNLEVHVEELLGTFEEHVKSTPMGALETAITTRLAGATFGGAVLDTNFWGSNAVGTGNIVASGGQITLTTGAVANSSGTVTSVRAARYIGGHSNYYRGVVRLPTVTGSNTRRWGAYNATSGFFFELQNGVLSVVSRFNGVDSKVANGSFNGTALGTTIDLDTNVHTYEIHWTNSSAWFVYGDNIIHKLTGSTAPLSDNMNLQISAECWNSSGNNAVNTMEVRVASISRFGQLGSEAIYKTISSATTTVCKYSSGRLQRVVVCNPNAGAQTITIYDNTIALAPLIGTLTVPAVPSQHAFAPFGIEYQTPFFNGLTVITSTANPVTFIYE